MPLRDLSRILTSGAPWPAGQAGPASHTPQTPQSRALFHLTPKNLASHPLTQAWRGGGAGGRGRTRPSHRGSPGAMRAGQGPPGPVGARPCGTHRGRLGGAPPPGPAGRARRGCGSPAAGRPAPASWRRARAERGRSPPHASGRTTAGDWHRRHRRRRRAGSLPSFASFPSSSPSAARADVRRGPGPPLTHPAPPPRLRRAAAGLPSAPGPASPQRRASPPRGLAPLVPQKRPRGAAGRGAERC